MKNIAILMITACVITLAACKKDASTKKTSSSVPANGWTLGATNYTAAFGARINSNSGTGPVVGVTAFDAIPSGPSSSANTLVATFLTAPTANGTYRVVQYPGTTALTATQVGITAAGPAGTYTSTGAGAVDVTVTVTSGKIKVVVPAVPVKKTTAAEELTATGTITEN